MVGMRWAIRSAGLVSTVILARVLTPQDFGIVAMSSLVYGLLMICSEMGAVQLLLRSGETDRQAYDTAWTIGLIQACLLAILMAIAAYPAALYFKEPRLVDVMQVVAAGSVLHGLNNIGVVMFRRDLEFRKDFVLGFFSKVVTVIPTVALALYLQSYWALVFGPIIGDVLGVIISYVMHPFRPRLSLVDWRRFAVFSAWIIPSNIALFLTKKADVFVVGFVANTAQLGIYNVASELSRMATAEVVIPMSRAIFPNFAKLRNDLKGLGDAFLLVVRTTCIISFSFGFGIAAVADDLVYVVLGDQWGFAASLMRWLGISGAFTAIIATLTGHILIVRGRERMMSLINAIKLAILAAVLFVAAHHGDLVTIAIAVTVAQVVITVGCVLYLPRIIPISFASLATEIVWNLLIGLIMFAAISALHMDQIEWRIARLLIHAAIGCVIFTTLLGLRWVLAGRPDGPEKRIWGLISNYWHKPIVRSEH
jgi:O-antigen/teichoic acid export membrane protein